MLTFDDRFNLMKAYTEKILNDASPDSLRNMAWVAVMDQLGAYNDHGLVAELRIHAPELLEGTDA